MWIPADDGLRQGAPLSCVLAALTGVKCVRAARDAMDTYHCLADSREPADAITDPKVREEIYARAAQSSEAVAMLDDASLLARKGGDAAARGGR